MFSAAADHRYLTTGHVLDFTNKAFEALDHGAHDLAEPVLASLCQECPDLPPRIFYKNS
jgi:hypothetical protein